jgi:hypothetical protein
MLTFDQTHDHVIVFPLQLSTVITLVPWHLQGRFSARLLDDVEELLEGVCLQGLVDGVACKLSDHGPPQRMLFSLTDLALFGELGLASWYFHF